MLRPVGDQGQQVVRGPLERWPRDRYGIKALTPYEFEDFVAWLLQRDGCLDVKRVGGAGDDGVDVRGRTVLDRPVAVQCKHLSNKVSPRQVREFLGAVIAEHRDGVAVFVTSSYFTKNADEFGVAHGLVLVNMQQLVSWAGGSWSPVAGR
ncbi:restriction endonuclease [Streptomyces sp. NPDC056159]|uniref:restriction endonuclease n=1 Tax=Streptomyces sp. NPDC056159 TaxID=3155537 RepID=UPI003442D4D6